MRRDVACFLVFLGIAGVAPSTLTKEASNLNAAQAEVKSLDSFYTSLVGEWVGSYNLWIHPDADVQESSSMATVYTAANGSYTVMNYSWTYKDKLQAGIFLLGGNGPSASATWGDSWHMRPNPMQCHGMISDNGNELDILGGYDVGEGPDWGWRTILTLVGENTLIMKAYNITPDGDEALAVNAVLTRVE